MSPGPRAAVLLCACLPACGREAAPALFREVTAEAGLDASPRRWPDGRYRIPEITPGGIAVFDCDGDGDLDIYQVCHPPPDAPHAPAPNRLFRQEPGGRFSEAPRAAGLDDPGYGSGVALGDIDQDGDLDVFVANLGPDALYRNNGDGTFTDVTAESGIRESEWSSSAAFFDHDRDGDLDLYVSRYLRDDPTRVCREGRDQARDYCGPSRYQAVPDLLLENRGDGTFLDVSARAGIVEARASFGVVCLDFTGDGWADIFVANDMQPNHLYVNRRDGTFVDRAMELGAALSGAGKPQAGMGVAVGDLDGDLRLDLLVTNLAEQTNTLYLHSGSPGAGAYLDRSASSGLGAPSLPFTGWGCGFHDFDHDGDLDLAVVNGRIARGPVRPGAAAGPFWDPYAEPNQLFWNQGGGKFTDASPRGGGFTARAEVTRGLAFGDLDQDGDIDLVTCDLGQRLRLYHNTAPARGARWLKVRALTGRRDALGALVSVEAQGLRLVRPVLSGYSFQCASEPLAHFGLGGAESVERIEVGWPSGRRERFAGVRAGGLVTVREGEGEEVR